VGEAVEERGSHFRIAEHAGPFAEAQVGCDEDAGALVFASLVPVAARMR
jgi:hypothetical protein